MIDPFVLDSKITNEKLMKKSFHNIKKKKKKKREKRTNVQYLSVLKINSSEVMQRCVKLSVPDLSKKYNQRRLSSGSLCCINRCQ